MRQGQLRILQAGAQHAHIETRIMRDDDAVPQMRLQLRPDGREVRCRGRILPRDAMDLRIEIVIAVAGRLNQRIVAIKELPVLHLDHGHAAGGIARTRGRLEVDRSEVHHAWVRFCCK